ncbi:hypothetical protein LMG23992_04549 [Cupriavidus laharis]|uniref:MYND finger n=1 Tax=Cupriavidus laharis TaxID=151654 RepID=A0ABM8XN65_9BURK|nr:PP0621 family protein [Cupriavidus laharis]CAG9181646.1 hypothetical protein LMG23992_04549 [Cupriavidus laharis]
MARILILLAVVLGVFWWLRSRAEAQREEAARATRPTPASRDNEAEAMVQCAHCGVHLPRSEAIAWRGLHYCRRSHLPEDSGDRT